jgi:hypothetical protein
MDHRSQPARQPSQCRPRRPDTGAALPVVVGTILKLPGATPAVNRPDHQQRASSMEDQWLAPEPPASDRPHSNDASHACPERGVVPSRFIDGDHEGGCSLAPRCPACGCDPTSMFHGATGCPAAAASATIFRLLKGHGVLLKARGSGRCDCRMAQLPTSCQRVDVVRIAEAWIRLPIAARRLANSPVQSVERWLWDSMTVRARSPVSGPRVASNCRNCEDSPAASDHVTVGRPTGPVGNGNIRAEHHHHFSSDRARSTAHR